MLSAALLLGLAVQTLQVPQLPEQVQNGYLMLPFMAHRRVLEELFLCVPEIFRFQSMVFRRLLPAPTLPEPRASPEAPRAASASTG